MNYTLALGQKSDSAVHDGLVFRVLTRVENIVLHGKKRGYKRANWGGGHRPQCPPSGSGPVKLLPLGTVDDLMHYIVHR